MNFRGPGSLSMQASRPSALFLNRVYPPADGATGQLLAELAPALVRAGWEITVVTSRPDGGPRPGAGASRTEHQEGVRIERVSGPSFTRSSHLRRALCYLALYPAFCWRVLRLPRVDWIVLMTDPPLLLVMGPLLAWCKGARLVHWAQDLYPELAEETGVLKRNGLVARSLRAASTWAMRRCTVVIAVGRCMQHRLTQRRLDPARLQHMANWAPQPVAWPSPQEREAFRKANGLIDRFVVMYSGNFGLAHSFDAILDAAQALGRSEPQITFLLAGHGPRRDWVEQEARRRKLANILFLPFQAKENLYTCLGAADLHLATMRTELCGLVVPSKVYGILAAGCPCVFLGPRASEAAQLIESCDCGSVLENASGAELARCVAGWARDASRLSLAAERCQELRGDLLVGPVVEEFQHLLTGHGHGRGRAQTPLDREPRSHQRALHY